MAIHEYLQKEGGQEAQALIVSITDKLIDKAVTAYNNAESAMQSGDWAAYGKHLDELESILNQLAA